MQDAPVPSAGIATDSAWRFSTHSRTSLIIAESSLVVGGIITWMTYVEGKEYPCVMRKLAEVNIGLLSHASWMTWPALRYIAFDKFPSNQFYGNEMATDSVVEQNLNHTALNNPIGLMFFLSTSHAIVSVIAKVGHGYPGQMRSYTRNHVGVDEVIHVKLRGRASARFQLFSSFIFCVDLKIGALAAIHDFYQFCKGASSSRVWVTLTRRYG